MTLTKLARWSLLATSLAVGVGMAVGAAEKDVARADTAQSVTCTWKSAGTAPSAVYHAATAVDKNGKIFILGGLNQNGQVQQTTQIVDMGATTYNGTAFAGTKSDSGRQMSQRLWGAAAAYVPSSDAAKSGKIYVFGGAKTDLDYSKWVGVATPPADYVVEGEDQIYVYDIDGDSWSTVSGAGSLGNRLFPAASYSPERNAILVTGGMKSCDFKGATTGNVRCSADTLPAVWLTFDAAGAVTGLTPDGGGPNKVYGHTSVYDATHKSILIFGGTSTGNNADRNAWQADLSGPTTAWKNLPNAPKGLAFHSAAYWTAKNWMIVNGGASSAFFRADEGFSSTTYGLDMGATPPVWVDLKASGLNPAERIGGVANYVSNAGGVMHVIMSTGRRKLPSNLASSQTVSRNTDGLDCVESAPPVTTVPPSATTPSGGTPTTPSATTPPPTADPSVGAAACPGLDTRVPAAALNAAVANKDSVSGWGMACNPNVPYNPVSNPWRTKLSLRNVNVPYHPIYNGLVWKCGCP